MKKIINTDKAPAPIGPYNQAVQAGDFLFISGQIALSPQSGELKNTSVEQEAIQVLENLQAVLTEAGYTFSDVVKTSIFLRSMDDFQRVNEVYTTYFTTNSPARETVAVAGLPKNVRVEISLVAYKAG